MMVESSWVNIFRRWNQNKNNDKMAFGIDGSRNIEENMLKLVISTVPTDGLELLGVWICTYCQITEHVDEISITGYTGSFQNDSIQFGPWWKFYHNDHISPSVLTHWGRMTHICVCKLTIIGSDNGLAPGWRQAIIWTNDGILLIGPLGTNFSEILITIEIFSFKKMHLKMLSVKWRPFCLDLNVLNVCGMWLDVLIW